MRRKPQVYSRPDSAYLWLLFYDEDERRVRKSSGTSVESEAQQMLDELLQEIESKKAARAGIEKLEVRFSIVATKRVRATQEQQERVISRIINANDPNAVEQLAALAREKVLELLRSSAGDQRTETTEQHPSIS